MRNLFILLILLPMLLTGCKDTGTQQSTMDRPEAFSQLLEHGNFLRAKALGSRHASIDTPELHSRTSTAVSTYETEISSKVLELESADELYSAVRLLEEALEKIPGSKIFQEHLDRVEKNRLDRVRNNERQQMIVRARYVIDKREYYRQQQSLTAPERREQREKLRNDRESGILAQQLHEHGKFAFETHDLQTAHKCLQLSMQLRESPETRRLLNQITTAAELQNTMQQPQADALNRNPVTRIRDATMLNVKKLLGKTREALAANHLVLAQSLFAQIPAPENATAEATALQEKLQLAVRAQIRLLASRGDREYRADDVISAIQTWSGAQKLEPDNHQLKERLDRAGRVLAKLEQFKLLQGK